MKRRKWLKITGWVLLTPILLIILVIILLYIPPIQNFACKKATEAASKATGMDIHVGRIHLRFPIKLLVRDVSVVQHQDTIASLESLRVRVQLLPLIKGKVEVDEVLLQSVKVNTGELIPTLAIEGELGRFYLSSHGVDLKQKSALINMVELSDTNLELILKDTIVAEQPDTTASAPVDWKFDLKELKISNLDYGMKMGPGDSTSISTRIGEILLKDGSVNLKDMAFGLNQFTLDASSFSFNANEDKPAQGFDPSHISVKNMKLSLDSLFYEGRDIRASINECSMEERSGLAISSLTAKVLSDSTVLNVPYLKLKTNHSQIDVQAHTYWELISMPTTGRLSARLNAFIGKQDVMLFAGDMPEAFKEAYPSHPLTIRAGTEGNLKEMQISRCRIDLPSAFSIDLGGELYNITDSLTRTINADFEMQTWDLNFLTALADMQPGAPLTIPGDMRLNGKVHMEGPQINGAINLLEGDGQLSVDAALNLTTEVYNADLNINNINVEHFLPHDSIYEVSASLKARGRGLDVMSKSAVAQVDFTLEKLQYTKFFISNIKLDAGLKNSLATFSLTSDNNLLQMKASGDYNLGVKYPDGSVVVDATHIGLYDLGVVHEPLRNNIAFLFDGQIKKENVSASFKSGDLDLKLSVNGSLNQIIDESDRLVKEIGKQFAKAELNLDELKELLPTVMIDMHCGENNVLAWYLATQKMSYDDITLKMRVEPTIGINVDFDIYTFKVDTFQIDTIFLDIRQENDALKLKTGVINGPKNPQMAFTIDIDGEVTDSLAQVTLEYLDGKGRKGLLLGAQMHQQLNEYDKPTGYLFNIIPQNPILAFQEFSFVDKRNWVYMHNTGRIYASVMMQDQSGMGIRVQSLPSDTVSLQNIDVEIHKLQLAEIFTLLPFLPDITGVLNLEAHYVQTEHSLQVSAETKIDSLTYDKFPMGDFAVDASWIPGENGRQYVSAYVAHDQSEILKAEGSLLPMADKKDSISVSALINHFPADIANAFVPQDLVSLSGGLSGDLKVTGFTDAPLLNGEVTMDSLSAYSPSYGARFTLGNEPLVVDNSLLEFKNFAIYTTSKNPFTVDGYLNFRDLMKPTANLKLKAKDYTLLDAKRTKESMVYGLVDINLDATVRGPLNDLTVGGNIELLGKTNVTYVLTDSPLTVSDRLSELVTFTNFADTASLSKAVVPTVNFGGINVAMNVVIDPTVQFRVDLSADRSSYVQVQGGGDLSLKLTPQGGINLTGRYTLSGGTVKYTLPVIPLKEFNVVSGSYIEWTGDVADPILNFTAMEKMRASVGMDNGSSRMVLFEISIVVKNRLEDLSLDFQINAPEDATVQNQLAMMGPEERQKQAIAMLATGIYLADSGSSGGFNMSSALGGVISSQINNLMGNIKGASINVGVDNTSSSTGANQTDYSISYSQKFFNDKFTIIIGGKVSTGADVTNDANTFIDNVRLEYRLDNSNTRYLQVFYDKNYESLLDGEVTEAGVGIVLRKKMDKLRELFIFNHKKKKEKRELKRKEEEEKRLQEEGKTEEIKKDGQKDK